MRTPEEFDEIRPYDPEELPAVFEELIADPEFRAANRSCPKYLTKWHATVFAVAGQT